MASCARRLLRASHAAWLEALSALHANGLLEETLLEMEWSPGINSFAFEVAASIVHTFPGVPLNEARDSGPLLVAIRCLPQVRPRSLGACMHAG